MNASNNDYWAHQPLFEGIVDLIWVVFVPAAAAHRLRHSVPPHLLSDHQRAFLGATSETAFIGEANKLFERVL